MGGRRSTPWDQYTVSESGLYLTDTTIANVSATRHGLVPKHPNDATKFFRGDGTWASVVGGGGVTSLYSRLDPLAPDSSATLGYEFTAASATADMAAFTKIYITGETGVTVDAATTLTRGLFMELPNQQYRLRSLLFAHPGDTNWTIHSSVVFAFLRPDDTNVAAAGIILSDVNVANTGTQRSCTISSLSGISHSFHSWAGFGNSASGAAITARASYDRINFLRVRKNAGTIYYAWSPDGLAWKEEAYVPGITINYIGLMAQNYTTQVGQCWFPYIRYFNTGTQFYTGAVRNELT